MSDNIQTNTTGQTPPCLPQKIEKTNYLVEVHFSDTSTQSVEDRLKRVILHDLEHGKQGKTRNSVTIHSRFFGTSKKSGWTVIVCPLFWSIDILC